MILHGDNADILPTLDPQSVTLAYLDPPFFTQRDFQTTHGAHAYSDRWSSLEDYLDALELRLRLLRPLLAPHGCVVVHVDPRTSAYVRVRGDGAFGRDAFASEIIWRYRKWPSRTRNFQRVHDVLLRWVVDPAQARWTQLYEPLAPSTLASQGTKMQRHQRRGPRAHRQYVEHTTTEVDSPGAYLGDVWEISIVAPSGRERTGYPTQKPEALLERLILTLGIDSSSEAVRVAGERTAQLRLEVA